MTYRPLPSATSPPRRGVSWLASRPESCACSRPASIAGVGHSASAEPGSRSPVIAFTRFLNSTSVSESNPSSRKPASLSTASGDLCPRMAATSSRTRSLSRRSRPASVTSASRSRSPGPVGPALDRAPGRTAEQALIQRRQRSGLCGRTQGGQVEPRRHQQRRIPGHRQVQQRQPFGRGQPGHRAADPGPLALAEVTGHAAGICP